MSENKKPNHDTNSSKGSKDFKIPRAERKKVSPNNTNASKGNFRKTKGRSDREFNLEFSEKVVNISRVTTVVKGGRRFSFSAIVVVGNKKGSVGWGHGKAKEVPDAIKKAIKDARKKQIKVPLVDKRTVPHEQTSKFLASKVMVKPAPLGKGIIASGAVRAVVELAGYKDIYTKSLGSRSKTNTIKATIKALSELRTKEAIIEMRGLKSNYFNHKFKRGNSHETTST